MKNQENGNSNENRGLVLSQRRTPLGAVKLRPRLFYEINLLRLEGHIFCFNPKAASRRTGGYTLSDQLKRPITVVTHREYGYPSVLAYKVLQAIMKKLSDCGEPYPEFVALSKRELARMTGRKYGSGRDLEQLHKALMQLRTCQITCSLKDKPTNRWATATFTILHDLYLSGKGPELDRCLIYINPRIVKSLGSRHYACLNAERMAGLEPLQLALFKRVFYHFSNLYQGNQRTPPLTFRKDYAELCRSWLGGLTPLRYLSKIKNEQLGAHLEALRRCGLLRSYAIERNAARDGFNIAFVAGDGSYTRKLVTR